LEELDVDGRIILKCIFKNCSGKKVPPSWKSYIQNFDEEIWREKTTWKN